MWFIHKLAKALREAPSGADPMDAYTALAASLRPRSRRFWGRASEHLYHAVHHPAIPLQIHVHWFQTHWRQIGEYDRDLVKEYGDQIALRNYRTGLRVVPNDTQRFQAARVDTAIRAIIKGWLGVYTYLFPYEESPEWEMAVPAPISAQEAPVMATLTVRNANGDQLVQGTYNITGRPVEVDLGGEVTMYWTTAAIEGALPEDVAEISFDRLISERV